jgi:hypothetical protein
MASILTSLIIVVGAMILVQCCVIPCVRRLVQTLIETALVNKCQYPIKITDHF